MNSSEPWAVGRLLSAVTAFLADKGAASPRLDAELLLGRVLNLSKIQLYVNFERELAPEELDRYRELVRRRAGSEPVAYILGEREFYGLRLKTTPAALIPRPETEHLVDEALRLVRDFWPAGEVSLADIGCGGGAIALALAQNLPRAAVSAVDLSPAALELARANALSLGLASRVAFHLGDLAAPLAGRRFHLVCANLPYVPEADLERLMPDVAWHEPRLALDGGPEGLGLIRRLAAAAPDLLEPGGRLLLEIWPPSLPSLAAAAGAAGLAVQGVVRDLAGHQRVAVLGRSV